MDKKRKRSPRGEIRCAREGDRCRMEGEGGRAQSPRHPHHRVSPRSEREVPSVNRLASRACTSSVYIRERTLLNRAVLKNRAEGSTRLVNLSLFSSFYPHGIRFFIFSLASERISIEFVFERRNFERKKNDGSVQFQREEKRNPTIERVESSKITRNGKARSDVQGEGTSTRGGRRVERVRERRYCSLSRTFNATAGVFTSVERTSRVNKIMQLLLFCTPGILD